MTTSSGYRLEVTSWLPIIGLAFAAFVFNTSEFLPVGLLPNIAESLGETVSFTGLMITGYAWVVAVMLPHKLVRLRKRNRDQRQHSRPP